MLTLKRATVLAVAGLLVGFGVPAYARPNPPPPPPSPPAMAPDSPLCLPRTRPPSVGLKLVRTKRVDKRLLDLTLHSNAMRGLQHVDVLLPKRFDARSHIRYPVLYLLHGFAENYTYFVRLGIEDLIGNENVIVVMPDGGYDGAYTDWYGQTTVIGMAGEAPAWETYHVRELVPFIDRTFPTVPSRSTRAIAGVSAGGYGAMKYAAHHPDLFGIAGALSGALDNDLAFPGYPAVTMALDTATLAPGAGPPAYCTWGDPITQDVVWRQNDPTYIASNLNNMYLWLASGDGEPGPYDALSRTGQGDPSSAPTDIGTYLSSGITESFIWQMNQSFVAALDAAGIRHTDYFYGPGTHLAAYWKQDLRRFVPWLHARFRRTLLGPPHFDYRTTDRSFDAWGWHFETNKLVREFTYLTGVETIGMTISGSGIVRVTTGPVYMPLGTYELAGAVQSTVRADRRGRISFAVDLGPQHLTQQYDFGPSATSAWTTKSIDIEPGRSP